MSLGEKNFELDVKVIPNASRDEVVGWHDGTLKLKTVAQPESGKANKAVCQLLAKHLGLSKKSVQVLRGQANPNKRLRIEGASSTEVLAKLPSKS